MNNYQFYDHDLSNIKLERIRIAPPAKQIIWLTGGRIATDQQRQKLFDCNATDGRGLCYVVRPLHIRFIEQDKLVLFHCAINDKLLLVSTFDAVNDHKSECKPPQHTVIQYLEHDQWFFGGFLQSCYQTEDHSNVEPWNNEATKLCPACAESKNRSRLNRSPSLWSSVTLMTLNCYIKCPDDPTWAQPYYHGQA